MNEAWDLADKLAGRVNQPIHAGNGKFIKGRILRSPVPRGRITALKLPPLPGGLTCIVPEDVPDKPKPYAGNDMPPVFAAGQVLWKGQPILAAAGKDASAVEDWLSRVELSIDETDGPLTEIEAFQRRGGRPSDVFGRTSQFIEESMLIPCREGPMEPRTVTCLLDGDSYHLHLETTWPLLINRSVAEALHLPDGCVKVTAYNPGPGQKAHDALWYPAPFAVIAALLSRKAKQSVCLDTTFGAAPHGPSIAGVEFRLRGAVDDRGCLAALEGDITIDAGAFMPLESETVDRLILGLFSFYPCPHYLIRGLIRRNPLSPSALGPAGGFELGFLAGELLASRIAETRQILPSQWRFDFLPKPHQTLGPGIPRPKDFPVRELLGRLLSQSDYERKASSYNQIRLNQDKIKRPPEHRRGIGTACAWFGNGFLGHQKELSTAGLSITLDKEGRLSISIPTEAPRSLRLAWSAMAGKALGIDKSAVRFDTDLPGQTQKSGPAILGNHVSVYTRLLEQALADLLKHRFREALPIRIDRTNRRSGRTSWNREKLTGTPFNTYSWGAGVVEVVLSSRASTVESVRIWLQIDGGRLLMPDCACAAVESSAEAALSWCTGRERGFILPQLDIQFFDGRVKRQPKDVAALPWLLVPAAFIEAVRQASGRDIDKLPVIPGQIQLEHTDE